MGGRAGRRGGSGARKVGCHAVVLCCRQGTSVRHSLSPCFTSLLAPRLYFPQISSHQPPQSTQAGSKARELADRIASDCSVKCNVRYPVCVCLFTCVCECVHVRGLVLLSLRARLSLSRPLEWGHHHAVSSFFGRPSLLGSADWGLQPGFIKLNIGWGLFEHVG